MVKVDCVVRKDGVYRQEEFSRRRRVIVDGESVTIVAPEDLILSKLEWAKESLSQMQLDDVRNLLRSVQSLDHAYLDRWVDRLRFYGHEFDVPTRNKILAAIERAAQPTR